MQDELTSAIANDLGIASLPPMEQQALIGQFGEVALKAATLSVMEKLSDEKRDAFAKLSEEGDAPAIKAFLDLELPGHEEVVKQAVAEEVKRFKNFQTA
ncbi:MAG: hypothetical protein KGI71_00365 [Patescibacteria group bacterium]|nr:hypothetical protein [Patescibacteria group bacterium]MDE2173342.1 hypothetical protein [Patescibacteria group bacterium]